MAEIFIEILRHKLNHQKPIKLIESIQNAVIDMNDEIPYDPSYPVHPVKLEINFQIEIRIVQESL